MQAGYHQQRLGSVGNYNPASVPSASNAARSALNIGASHRTIPGKGHRDLGWRDLQKSRLRRAEKGIPRALETYNIRGGIFGGVKELQSLKQKLYSWGKSGRGLWLCRSQKPRWQLADAGEVFPAPGRDANHTWGVGRDAFKKQTSLEFTPLLLEIRHIHFVL